nr:DnaD domain protein [Clostridiales bacterium]
VVGRARQIRKFSKEKYRTFNEQLHALFPDRNILPGEYNAYYSVMETYNIEIEAMLTVIGYCKRLKGDDITYPYIVTVAKNFAAEGYVTYERVNEKINELDLYGSELKAVVKALGKKTIEHDDKRLYGKWTKEFGFGTDVIVNVAKTVKKGGILKLDAKLTKYYELHLTSLSEIENYENNREALYDLAKKINRTVGVYYEQLDFIIETYTVNWLGMGFDAPTLLKVAEYCFLHGIRTLEAMNDTLKKLYRKGCVSGESIAAFVQDAAKSDSEIKEIFDAAGVTRTVGTRDRDAYRTWNYSWNLPKDVILYGAELARKAESPLSYLNAVLASWHEKGITTIEQAKAAALPAVPAAAPSARVVTDFSADELNAAFDKLNEEL